MTRSAPCRGATTCHVNRRLTWRGEAETCQSAESDPNLTLSVGATAFQMVRDLLSLLDRGSREKFEKFDGKIIKKYDKNFAEKEKSSNFACYQKRPRKDAGVVDRDGLENRCTLTGTQGSNPCLSAKVPKYISRKSL